MSRLTCVRLSCCLALLLAGFTTTVFAQNTDFGKLFLLTEESDTSEPEITITLNPETAQVGDEVTLSITASIPKGSFTYSLENKGGAKPNFRVTDASGLEPVDEEFQTDQEAESSYDALAEKTSLKYFEKVTWTRRYKVTGPQVLLAGKASMPICDAVSCQMFHEPFQFEFEAGESGTADDGAFGSLVTDEEDGAFGSLVAEDGAFGAEVDASEDWGLSEPNRSGSGSMSIKTFPFNWSQEVTVDGKFIAKVSATLKPDESGQTPRVQFTAEMADGWHTYSLDEKYSQKTSFEFTDLHGLKADVSEWKSDKPPETYTAELGKETIEQSVHYKVVTWTKNLERLPEAENVGVELKVALQFCSELACLPQTFKFRLGTLPVAGEQVAADFPASFEDLPPEVRQFIDEIRLNENESIRSISFGMYMIYAFLGGIILNVMPCVLPVLAIKVLSFVKQAGESRSRIVALNIAYSAGVISIFMILATLISLASLAWGGLFQSTTFNMVMVSIIFAMALSLLGVYELPIPGLVGSAHGQQKDGLTGAFLTGVFATVLATPCSGPFLGTTLAWAAQQPIMVTYLTFFMLGLGMASPYLILGAFPQAIKFLPKPGTWMVRVKEISGFILLATVIFILTYVEEKFRVPLMFVLLVLGFSLWMIGQAPATLVSKKTYWMNRVAAISLTVAVAFYSYRSATHVHESELPWRPFNTFTLMEASSEGKTVLIDFTADWCINCKVVENTALNTPATYKLVEEHDIVPLVADYTDGDEEIAFWLDKFESKSIPLTVIFPANRPQNPILIRDLYLQDALLEKLNLAVSLPPEQTAAKADANAQ